MSHSSVLRHLLNLGLTRAGQPEIPTLEAEPLNLHPLMPHLYPLPDLDEPDEEGMTLRQTYESLPYEVLSLLILLSICNAAHDGGVHELSDLHWSSRLSQNGCFQCGPQLSIIIL